MTALAIKASNPILGMLVVIVNIFLWFQCRFFCLGCGFASVEHPRVPSTGATPGESSLGGPLSGIQPRLNKSKIGFNWAGGARRGRQTHTDARDVEKMKKDISRKGAKRQWSDVGGQWTERKTEEVQSRGYAGENNLCNRRNLRINVCDGDGV